MSGVMPGTIPLHGGALGERQGQGQLAEIVGWGQRTPASRVAFMREVVNEYRKDPEVAVFTMNTVIKAAGIPAREYQKEASAILRWVQRNIRYVNEPDERIQSPWATLRWRLGDCDDLATLVATMAESVGLATRFILAGPERSTGQMRRWIEGDGHPSPAVEWGHVYLMIGWPALNPQRWASAEPSMADAPFGYDVVLHGVIGDADGRIRVPRPGERTPAGGSMPEFRQARGPTGSLGGPLGGVGPRTVSARRGFGDAAAAAAVEEPKSPASSKFWKNALILALESVPGVIVATIVSFYATQWISKRGDPRGRRRRSR